MLSMFVCICKKNAVCGNNGASELGWLRLQAADSRDPLEDSLFFFYTETGSLMFFLAFYCLFTRYFQPTEDNPVLLEVVLLKLFAV